MNETRKFQPAWIFLCGFTLLLAAVPAHLESYSSQEGLEQLLTQLRSYEQGSPDEVIEILRKYVGERSRDGQAVTELERHFITFLESDATPDAKKEVCRHLGLIGSAESVPALKRLLFDEETSDMARYALERIPSRDVDDALIASLGQSSGKIRLGIISSLGHRKTAGAAPVLGEQLESPDPGIVSAALTALGHIANQEAADLLAKTLEEAADPLAARAAASLFKCAEEFRHQNRHQSAHLWYGQILQNRTDLSLRRAALKGKILTSGDKAGKEILEVLRAGETPLHATAISLVPQVYRADSLKALCGLLPELPIESQIQLLAALSSFDSPDVLETALNVIESREESLRMAALAALERVGDGSTVAVLVKHASLTKGEEQRRARFTLWNLRGKDIDPAVLEALEQKPEPDAERELILSVRERYLVTAKGLLFDLAQGAQTLENRLEAIRALGEIGAPQDVARMTDRLLAADDGKIRQQWIEAAASAANKAGHKDHRAQPIQERLAQAETIRERRLLYRVLGLIGDNGSLPVLREALVDPNNGIQDTAVRALAKWPDPTPMEDLLKIAESTADAAQQVLALRAYIRMAGMTPAGSPEIAAGHLGQALQAAGRDQEKLYVLSMLSRFPCQEALEIAESLTGDAAVRTEALMAVQKIKSGMQ